MFVLDILVFTFGFTLLYVASFCQQNTKMAEIILVYKYATL